MTIYSAKTLRSLPLTTTLSLLLFLVCRSFAIAPAPPPPPPPPPPPSVVVTTGDPGDPDPGDTDSCDVSASVDNAPDPGNEATLIPHWSWSIGTVTVHPYDGGSDVTADSGDFHVSLKPIHDPGKPDDGMIDDSNSAATFTGTFRLTGYYAVPLIATVTYYYKDSGKYYGSYSGSDFVGDSQDNPAYDPANDTSGTSSAAPAKASKSAAGQPQAPADGPAPAPETPPLPKRVPSGLLATLPDPVKLGLYSKNHATETYTIPVVPKSLFGDVKFTVPSGVASIGSKPETTINSKGQTVNTGRLILTLTAVKPTNPASPLPGDAVVATRASTGRNVGGATVLVLEPSSVRQTSFHQVVNAVNFLENTQTSPADIGTPAPSVDLVTLYQTRLSIQVLDQFGRTLDAIFAGTTVSEVGSTGSGNINSPITQNGTYSDPVGPTVLTHYDLEPNAQTPNSLAWVAQSGMANIPKPASQADGSITQNIAVSVGGKLLTPSIKRIVKFTATIPANHTGDLEITPL